MRIHTLPDRSTVRGQVVGEVRADDISFLGWLVEFGEGARVAALITKIRSTT